MLIEFENKFIRVHRERCYVKKAFQGWKKGIIDETHNL